MTSIKQHTQDPTLIAKASIAALVLAVDLSLVAFGGAVATGLLRIG